MIGVPMGRVEFVELPIGFRLAGKELDNGHARNGFAEISIDARDPLADLAVGLPSFDAKVVNGNRHRRDQGQ